MGREQGVKTGFSQFFEKFMNFIKSNLVRSDCCATLTTAEGTKKIKFLQDDRKQDLESNVLLH